MISSSFLYSCSAKQGKYKDQAWQQKFKTMRGWGKGNESVLVSTNDSTKTKDMHETWKCEGYTIYTSIWNLDRFIIKGLYTRHIPVPFL